MALECLDEKEPQRRYPVDHRAGGQLALGQQIGLIGAKFVGAELVGRLAEILSELGHHPQVIAGGDGGIVATLEFLQHHFSGSERETVTPPVAMDVLILRDSGYTRQDERGGLEQGTGLAGVSGLPTRNRRAGQKGEAVGSAEARKQE